MKGKASPAIALRISNNTGGYYFINLRIGRCTHSHQWGELPIDDYIIERVECLTKCEKKLVIHDGYSHFEWVKGRPIIDDRDETFDVNYPIVDVLNK